MPVLLCLLIFCFTSISFGLLMLLLVQIFAFVQASVGMRRENNGVAQKRFAMVMAGGVIAIFGHALGSCWQGRILGLFGLLLLIPNGVTTLLFARFYERLTLRAFLGSVVIPAFAAIYILSRWKEEISGDLEEGWRYALLSVGSITVLVAGVMGLARLRVRSVMVFWSHSWIGFALLVLAAPSESLMSQALAAIATFAVSSVVLMTCALQLGKGHFVFSRVSSLGFPGLVGFMALYFMVKVLIELGLGWAALGFIGFIMQAITLVLCHPKTPQVSNRKARIRFWTVVAVQGVSGGGMLWFLMGGLK
ncbi:MAG: hypothetical protein KGP28_02050 [Bdellovibrionales bacterium]|nr:hypothetical protein [Bdellovibrionales bacterium]